jgi:predicted DCC family thiol-disulfide oxidoreductase YuxK
MIARDRAGYFKFAARQSEAGERLMNEHGIDPEITDSVILIEDGKAFAHSAAALRIARRLDGIWPVFFAFVIVPRPIRDAAYKLFARYRYQMFGKKDECMLPSPEIRARFI